MTVFRVVVSNDRGLAQVYSVEASSPQEAVQKVKGKIPSWMLAATKNIHFDVVDPQTHEVKASAQAPVKIQVPPKVVERQGSQTVVKHYDPKTGVLTSEEIKIDVKPTAPRTFAKFQQAPGMSKAPAPKSPWDTVFFGTGGYSKAPQKGSFWAQVFFGQPKAQQKPAPKVNLKALKPAAPSDPNKMWWLSDQITNYEHLYEKFVGTPLLRSAGKAAAKVLGGFDLGLATGALSAAAGGLVAGAVAQSALEAGASETLASIAGFAAGSAAATGVSMAANKAAEKTLKDPESLAGFAVGQIASIPLGLGISAKFSQVGARKVAAALDSLTKPEPTEMLRVKAMLQVPSEPEFDEAQLVRFASQKAVLQDNPVQAFAKLLGSPQQIARALIEDAWEDSRISVTTQFGARKLATMALEDQDVPRIPRIKVTLESPEPTESIQPGRPTFAGSPKAGAGLELLQEEVPKVETARPTVTLRGAAVNAPQLRTFAVPLAVPRGFSLALLPKQGLGLPRMPRAGINVLPLSPRRVGKQFSVALQYFNINLINRLTVRPEQASRASPETRPIFNLGPLEFVKPIVSPAPRQTSNVVSPLSYQSPSNAGIANTKSSGSQEAAKNVTKSLRTFSLATIALPALRFGLPSVSSGTFESSAGGSWIAWKVFRISQKVWNYPKWASGGIL